MFRAKDVILYKKIRFRFSSERFVDIPKKSIMCIFAYLSFLGKLLKEFRHGKFVAQIMAFDVPEVFVHRFAAQEAQKTLFQKIFFKKRLKKIFEFPILKSTRYPSFVSKRIMCSSDVKQFF